MAKALVTGATGFVGSHLVRELVRRAFEVHIFCRPTSNFWRLAEVLHSVRAHVVDLRDRPALKDAAEAICPDFIFHLAAATMHGGISRRQSEVLETNLLGTVNMIEACNEVGYRCFVNTGDSFEYGPKQEPMKESDTCHPDTIDGIAKLSASLYGQYVAQKQSRPIVTLRLFSVFGSWDDPRRLIPKVLQGALDGVPLMLSRPEIARDYIYVDDLVALYLAVIQNPPNRITGEIFNAGSGRQTTIGGVIDSVFRVTDSKTEVRWNTYAPAAHDTARWQADMTKTFGVVSWRPRFTLESALREIIRQQAAYAGMMDTCLR